MRNIAADQQGKRCGRFAAHLARFTGLSRSHAESDLRIYFAWCTERGVDPEGFNRRVGPVTWR
jgi:hypothetical protein